MTRDEILRWVLKQAPRDAYQRLVLMELALECNENCVVAPTPAALAARTGLNEKTVRRIIGNLAEAHYLEQISGNVWQLTGPSPSRARAIGIINNNNNLKDKNKKTVGAELHQQKGFYRGNSASTSEPLGTGVRQSLGIENCPKCGGTGWKELWPPIPGQQPTVDVCPCRGGPETGLISQRVTPDRHSMRQRIGNAGGIASVREVLDGQSQTRTEHVGMEDSQETGPGA